MSQRWSDHPAVRWWPVFGVGVLLTALALLVVSRDTAVHWARAEVTLATTATLSNPSMELGPGASLIPMTTVLERALADDMPHAFVSDEAPFYGVVDQGLSVRQLDTGGQWVHNFSAPTLIVEVVDPSAQRVEDRLGETVEQVQETLTTIQGIREYDQDEHITAVVDEVRRAHLALPRSELARAAVMVLAVGLTVSVVGCYAVDAAVRARRGSRPVTASPPRALEHV